MDYKIKIKIKKMVWRRGHCVSYTSGRKRTKDEQGTLAGIDVRSGIEELHAEVNARLLAQQVASKERFGRVSEWLLVF